MKRFFQILVIVMLATTSGACTSPPGIGSVTDRETPSNRNDNMEKTSIPLSLPNLLFLPNKALVLLEDGKSRSGQVVGMDRQELTIEAGNSRRSLPIDKIDYVKLEGHIYIWSSSEHALPPDDAIDPNSKLIFSLGDAEPSSIPIFEDPLGYVEPSSIPISENPKNLKLVSWDNWTKVDQVQFLVRIDGFELEDSERGIARIEPEAVVPVDGQDVISSGDSRYVVTEMRFIPEDGQMEITAVLVRPS